MGREIRRVPANWQHPKDSEGSYHPLHDQSFEEAAAEWKQGFKDWEAGIPRPYQSADAFEKFEYWEYAGDPPVRAHFRPCWSADEATHYQMYETTTEGTPVTPVFATTEELVEYLVKYGEDGDGRPWARANAERFVTRMWAPSMVIGPDGIKEPKDL